MARVESISYKIVCSRCEHEVEVTQEYLDNMNENNFLEKCNNCGMKFTFVFDIKEVGKELRG